MRIIPAIDIINGKCVRLTKGDYNTKIIYNENPLEVAKEFEANGIKYLHLVDLDGAKSKQIINHKVLYDIASNTSLSIDFGGGIKSKKDVETAFENGAKQITGGSIAVDSPTLFNELLNTYGAERIILGADSHNDKIATHGWQKHSDINLIDFIKEYKNKGVKYVICTDISKDGMLEGPSTDLYEKILELIDIQLIASGGITSINDLTALKEIGCEGAIIGKAIYEGKIKLHELQEFI